MQPFGLTWRQTFTNYKLLRPFCISTASFCCINSPRCHNAAQAYRFSQCGLPYGELSGNFKKNSIHLTKRSSIYRDCSDYALIQQPAILASKALLIGKWKNDFPILIQHFSSMNKGKGNSEDGKPFRNILFNSKAPSKTLLQSKEIPTNVGSERNFFSFPRKRFNRLHKRAGWRFDTHSFPFSMSLSPSLRHRLRSLSKLERISRLKMTASAQLSKMRAFSQKSRYFTNYVMLKYIRLAERKRMIKRLRLKLLENSKKAGHGLMALWKKYRYAGLFTYFGVYGISLWALYVASSQGLITTDNVSSLVKKLNLQNHINLEHIEKVDSFRGHLILAWLACKIIEPLRALLALALTPRVARFCWHYGILKKPI
ncbi:hypothetical protein IE077_001402 [Cardiosporidium cionae]|uniref:DUF1279 domain-containing protein n=1 Tax=Cardiosporidium cionae TaxID=476202 RepID=A0ABQ7JDE9_9APIC|nr:hypothetical protein IE077_001402 [Cardiosporidium cionae]|eukprot:KAF8821894.1 hypothetical protein IE077_001402 [Cardiosporidium cionae]